jgi:3D (Asp-Asp-Asp) domain-containing protein
MDFSMAPELRQRATWKFNRLTIAYWSAWMTAVLWVRHFAEGIVRLPRTLRRQITPLRAAAGLGIVGLVITPTVLYKVERGRHLDTQRAYRQLSISSTTETRYLESAVRGLLDEQSRLATLVLETGNTLYSNNRVYVKVLATGYSSTIAQTDSTPFVTAANTPSRPGVLAASQDLLREYTPGAPFSFGDRVKIYGVGDFIVEDCMNPRWTNRVDIWFPSRDEAIRFGLREVVLSGSLDGGADIRGEILSGNYSAETFPGGL